MPSNNLKKKELEFTTTLGTQLMQEDLQKIGIYINKIELL